MTIIHRLFVRGLAKMSEKPSVIFVLGGPGAGKGTICKKVFKKYGYVHLSAGDLLREERNRSDSEYGNLIETHIKEGTIVPVKITCSLLERAMVNSDSPNKRFLIDGFPRNEDNLTGWNEVSFIFLVIKQFHISSNSVFCDQIIFYFLIQSF